VKNLLGFFASPTTKNHNFVAVYKFLKHLLRWRCRSAANARIGTFQRTRNPFLKGDSNHPSSNVTFQSKYFSNTSQNIALIDTFRLFISLHLFSLFTCAKHVDYSVVFCFRLYAVLPAELYRTACMLQEANPMRYSFVAFIAIANHDFSTKFYAAVQ